MALLYALIITSCLQVLFCQAEEECQAIRAPTMMQKTATGTRATVEAAATDEGTARDTNAADASAVAFLEEAENASAAHAHWCSNGVRSEEHHVCCAPECGACSAGPECLQKKGGPSHCCVTIIKELGHYCKSWHDTGCNVPQTELQRMELRQEASGRILAHMEQQLQTQLWAGLVVGVLAGLGAGVGAGVGYSLALGSMDVGLGAGLGAGIGAGAGLALLMNFYESPASSPPTPDPAVKAVKAFDDLYHELNELGSKTENAGPPKDSSEVLQKSQQESAEPKKVAALAEGRLPRRRQVEQPAVPPAPRGKAAKGARKRDA